MIRDSGDTFYHEMERRSATRIHELFALFRTCRPDGQLEVCLHDANSTPPFFRHFGVTVLIEELTLSYKCNSKKQLIVP